MKHYGIQLKKKGLHLPIIINQNGVILDGHHRCRACTELNIEPRFEVKTFEDEFEEKEFVIEINLKRRQLPEWEKLELALKLEEIYKEKARFRQLSKLKNVKETLVLSSLSFLPNGSNDDHSTTEEEGEVVKIVSKKIGLSPRKIYRYKNVMNNGSEEIQEKVKSGQMSISYADELVRRSFDHKTENIPKLPEGQFDIILADPPWTYEFTARGNAQSHYSTMTLENICKMEIPSADNSILFLWTTVSKLEESLQVMNSWGFKYRSNAVWVKDKIGNGYYFRGQHEILLLGKKGEKIPTPEEKNRPSSVIHAPRTEHSKKPDQVYELIEKMYPNRKYLEIFARRERQDWTSWGKELQ
jgi:N6-adenosine-specific RNA methylase IME4